MRKGLRKNEVPMIRELLGHGKTAEEIYPYFEVQPDAIDACITEIQAKGESAKLEAEAAEAQRKAEIEEAVNVALAKKEQDEADAAQVTAKKEQDEADAAQVMADKEQAEADVAKAKVGKGKKA